MVRHLDRHETAPDLSRSAGILYASDLFGGWLGGIFGGIILLPVLGLFNACSVVVALKLISMLCVRFCSGR